MKLYNLMVSLNDEIETNIDNLLELAKKCISENIPFKDKSYGPEWDSLSEALFQLLEKDKDLNGLTDCLTQYDIETYDDVEFKPYHEFIPKYKNIVYKFLDLIILTSADNEEFINRTKLILEDIKQRFN